jgi:predicted ATPase
MDHRMGRQRADKVLALAQNLGTPTLLVQAHHCQWATLYMLGAHSECCRHVEVGLGLYEPARDRVDAALYSGHDARVCALGEGGLARWMLGYPQRARELVHSALTWAEELAHVGSRAHAMDFALVLQRFRRDVPAVYLRAGDLIDFAAEQKLRVFRARGAFFRGWARAMHDDPAAGLTQMLEGIAAARAADTPHDFPLYYEMLAEIYARAGRIEEGLRSVDDGFDVAERHGIVFWNAELHRRRGELMLASGERDAAEACFQEALSCARAHEARALELRAAASLVRMQQEQRASTAALVNLRTVYASFSEGFDTPDLTEARKLLEAPR